MRSLIVILMLAVASPALAQHSGHKMPMSAPVKKPAAKPAPKPVAKPAPAKKRVPAAAKKAPAPAKKAVPAKPAAPTKPKPKPKPKPTPTPAAKPAAPAATMDRQVMDHNAMGHDQMDPAMPMADGMDPAMPMDHGQMDHGQMDPAMPMDHDAMDHDAMAIPLSPPPPEAGSGPARAAEAIYGPEAMLGAREALRREHGGQPVLWFQADRAEVRARQGRDGYLWDLQGYYGGDIDKFWFKSEGEGSFGDKPEAAEVQALWSHAITPWFDLQAGVRHDFAGPDRTHAVIGIQGLAPYLFELDAAAFLSNRGDVTARIEGEIDQRITQRLILQPRGEMNLSAQDIPALGIGAGIDSVELGVRLRYEIAREFAPYVGIEQEWKLGKSADYTRAAGEDPGVTNYVVGVRFWF